jgi:hypothetical protein
LRRGINGIINMLLLGVAGCGGKQEVSSSAAAVAPSVQAAATASPRRSTYYSEKFLFHVRYPGTSEIQPASIAGGETFVVDRGGVARLHGSVWGEEGSSGITPAKRCAQRIRALGLTAVPYTIVKDSWYVFSGTLGPDLYYEKGLIAGSVKTLLLKYPVGAKAQFDPLVPAIANSFESYEIFTGRVSSVIPNVKRNGVDAGGFLWFAPKDGDAHNERVACYYEPQHSDVFESLQEGQSLTVAGFPKDVVIRESSPEQSGLYEHAIRACVITAK